MRVLLSHAEINAGIGCVEGANQQASVGVHDTIVQMDLGGKKKRGCRLKFMKNPTGNILNKERPASHCDVGGQGGQHEGVDKHRRCLRAGVSGTLI